MKFKVIEGFRLALNPREQAEYKPGDEVDVPDDEIISWQGAGYIGKNAIRKKKATIHQNKNAVDETPDE